MHRIGRGRRIIPIIAIVGIAALTLIGAGVLGGGQAPAYLRINVYEKSTVYLEFQGSELRAAMSVEGLKTAVPVKMPQSVGSNAVRFPEITLPIPADQLPAGMTAVKASLILYPTQVRVLGPGTSRYAPTRMGICQIAMSRTDDQKAEWQYVVQLASPTADSADKAPAVQLPGLDKLTLSVQGKPQPGTLGVGVQLLAGKTNLSEVRKDGKSVNAKVTVLDASGKEVASKKGPLADFGFS